MLLASCHKICIAALGTDPTLSFNLEAPASSIGSGQAIPSYQNHFRLEATMIVGASSPSLKASADIRLDTLH